MIVCFDTNVLVSAVATRGLCADVVNAALAEHELIIGETVLKELRQVLRQKLRLPVVAVDEMDVFLRLYAIVIADAPVIEFPGLNENDRAVLAEGIESGTQVVIIGASELLGAELGVAK